MGANTIRIYTVQQDIFYEALYEYNKDNNDPLYVIHGVWVNDYIQNSHRDAYNKDFYNRFLKDCKTMIDVVHGQKKLSLSSMASAGHGNYRKDISQWVIGYILGVEWEDITVAYTMIHMPVTENIQSIRADICIQMRMQPLLRQCCAEREIKR